MDIQISDIECPKCGHHTHERFCSNIFCEDGEIDYSDEDFLLPGTKMIKCDTCNGTGVERWCPNCGYDLTGDLWTGDTLNSETGENEYWYE